MKPNFFQVPTLKIFRLDATVIFQGSKQTQIFKTIILGADRLDEYKKDSNTLVNPHLFFDNGSFF